MPEKLGNGGHGPEKFDEKTGKYVADIQKNGQSGNFSISPEELSRQEQIDKEVLSLGDTPLKKFEEYEPRIQYLTTEMLQKAFQEEPQIKNDIVNLSKYLGGELVGLEHSIKSKESLANKLNENINFWGNSEQKAMEMADDVVRFTILFDRDDLVESFDDMVNYLLDHGYKYKYFQNRYLKGKGGEEQIGYKDLNIKLYNPNGHAFEIQVMTPEMYKAKNEPGENGLSGHDIYNLQKHAKNNFDGEEYDKRVNYLNYLTDKIYGSIEQPRNIKEINRERYMKGEENK